MVDPFAPVCRGQYRKVTQDSPSRRITYYQSIGSDFAGKHGVGACDSAGKHTCERVKPDRHLCRVAQAAGYSSPAAMCETIALDTGDRLAIVDLVIWRYATLTKSYCENFAAAQ